MKELMVKGTQTFLGKEIPVVEGGFGEDQRVVLAKTVAEIHDSKLIHVNELINKNINRFNTNDILDLKVIGGSDNNFESFGFTRMQVAKANNIYLLSERGYTKLVAMMDNKNEKKWIEGRREAKTQKFLDELVEEDFEIIDVVDTGINKYHLNILEAYYINEFDSYNNGYNNNSGCYKDDDGLEEFIQILKDHNIDYEGGK